MDLYRIILVDDEEEVRKSIIRKIDWQAVGFTVVGDAENGEDALEKLEALEPDVVLTDIRMPYMDGLTLAEKIRQRYPSMKIVIFSGYDDFDYAKRAIKLNVTEYILKPVNVEELTAITTSLSVATTLAENDECTVIQLGGVLRNSSFSVVGPFAEQMLRQFSCSKLFFGVDGFDLNYGVTTTNLMGGHLALMMIDTVQKVIALVDSSKFGRRGFCKMCDVDRIDMVITDDGVSPIVVEQLQEAGIDVRIVEVIRTTVP